uniref:Uncharacterized protein n=1 Tax=Rhizophora mucronata TaxID=61149 RepID=A0A2P2NQV7_RHIMU
MTKKETKKLKKNF